MSRDWYVRLGESTQCESVLNRILSKKIAVDCGDFNMREPELYSINYGKIANFS